MININTESPAKVKNIIVSTFFATLFAILMYTPTSAAPVTGFDAGRIIDDIVFTNPNSMNPSQIQAFLDSKVSTCDTWGTQPYGGTTRAAYAASRGVSTPFVCMENYTENGKSASQIIYDTAQKYSINPQVIIVMLQKEQGLITDDWPWSTQYRTALGYGCPDSGPNYAANCNASYYGFTNQVDWAAKMFRAIINNSPTWYTPYVLGNNYIQYDVDPNCGGTTVNIQNRSTQALYNYTPYQPTQAALNAGYGSAEPCGAYGNRNFYLYFTEWFGSVRSFDTLNPHPSGTLVSFDGRIYVIKGQNLHYISNATIFESYNYRWQDVKPATAGDKKLNISWSVDFINPGVLYRGEGTGVYSTVYEDGMWVKKHMSQYTFNHLGYRWDQVRFVAVSDMPLETSQTINFSSQHPQGALIGNNQGVFMVDNGTRRYITPSVFESHRWFWGDVVLESAEDVAMPVGANMLLRDGSIISDESNLYVVEVPLSGAEIKRPIGPWYCYADVFRYNTSEVIRMNSNTVPVRNGPIVTC